jgi:hypothetical protein
MSKKFLPRYPVYIPSKGRAESSLTARFLNRDKVPFHLVVEPQEYDEYASRFGEERVLVLPFSNLGLGSIPARNWIRDHSIAAGHKRHWQIDDNCVDIRRLYKGKRIPCDSGVALRVVEDFTDRYTNIGVSGLNYHMFVLNETPTPFYLNCHVYSCSLVWNEMPYKWRGRYNEDTDLCLQVLSAGLCTVALNVFMIDKQRTMKMKGGNSDELYKGDGRTTMARSLERAWPYVVDTKRRFNRPQHVIRGNWRGFDTPLQRRSDIDWDNLNTNEYGLELVQVKDTIRSSDIQALVDERNK